MGGAWVHWQQPHVFAELQKCGLDDFVETQALPERCSVFSQVMASGPLTVASPDEAAETFATIEKLMSKFLDIDSQGGHSVIPFPFSTPRSIRSSPSYIEIDGLSIQDRVNQLQDLSDED